MKILIIGSDPGSSQLRNRPTLIEPGEYKRILDADASKHPDRVGKNTDDWVAINATGLNCCWDLVAVGQGHENDLAWRVAGYRRFRSGVCR